jgi:hypothetical protein
MRTQIQLDGEAHRRAKRRAHELGISLAEYIRRLVDADLGRQRGGEADLAGVVDLGDGGATDIARDKRQLIGEALSSASLEQDER